MTTPNNETPAQPAQSAQPAPSGIAAALASPTQAPAPVPAKKKARVEDDEDRRDSTQLEVDVAKYEREFLNLKHVDVKDAMSRFVFPLLRALAKNQGDVADLVEGHETEIGDLHTAFDAGALGVEGDQQVDALALAFQTMAALGGLLDEVMVTAGFYIVNKDGVPEATKKVPRGLNSRYMAMTEQVGKTIAIIQVALRARQEEEEREDLMDKLEDEIDETQKAFDALGTDATDEARAELQAKIATLKAQLDALSDDDDDDADDAADAAEPAKDGE